MPFINVDYKTRDKMVKDYLVRKKQVRDRLLAERVGDIELQQDLTKFFKPLTKAQKEIQEEATKNIGAYQLEAARRITQGLTPIREGIEQLPGKITEGLEPIREGIIQLPIQLSKEMKTSQLQMRTPPPSYREITAEENEEEIRNFVKDFNIKLEKYSNNFDNIYKIHYDADLEKFKFGDKVISYNPNNKTFSTANNQYQATDGLWELILSNNPKNYTKKDLNAYQHLVYSSNILFKDNNQENELKMYNRFGEKWRNIIEPVYDYILKEKEKTGKGLRKKKKTTTVIPSDPNALLERFDLLMSSKDAGNTGVKNELVSICDELKRQKVLNAKSYKKLMSIL